VARFVSGTVAVANVDFRGESVPSPPPPPPPPHKYRSTSLSN
jgi:hypothetical protein